MEIICGIYKIENLINNKCYIGQSVNIKRRWKDHKEASKNIKNKNYDYPLYKAIRKYGLENFSFGILEKCSENLLNEKEKYWIKYFNSYNNGYNQNEGGNSGSHYIKLSKEKVLEIINYLKISKESSEIIGEKFGVSGRTIRAINSGEESPQDGVSYPIREKLFLLDKTYTKCKICGKITENKKYCSQKCSQIAQQRVKRPSREELKNLIKNFSFVFIGEKFNVSDNTIRKWCKNYQLPYRTKDIKKYSNEEWNKI